MKSGLIHLLPTFHGFAGEDPNKHFKEFHVVCSSMRPTGVTEEQIKLRAFPFSLADSAKEWLYYLPSGTITAWNGMKKHSWKDISQHLRLPTLEKKYVGLDNTMEKPCMNIGRGSRNFVLHVHTIR